MSKAKTAFLSGTFILYVVLLVFVRPLSATISDNSSLPEPEIGIVERLGEYVPLDLSFVDSNGDTILLKDYVDKPTVVSLVYYNCPGICSPLLSGKVDVLDRMPLEPGKDYKALTISFNPHETPSMGKAKKRNYFNAFQRRQFPPEHWKWMTGDSLSIQKLTDAFGFKYKKVGTEYVHAGALMVISPEGKISRYLRGVEFQPFDLKMAVLEAAEGRVGPTISKVLLYCFSYDPKGKQYTLNVMKVGGTIFLVMLVAFVAVLTLKSKTRNQKER